MPLDQLLIEVLACPIDKGPLLWFEDENLLYNPRLKKGYEVRDDIPVLLLEESRDMSDAEHERLVAKAAADDVPRTGSAGGSPLGGASSGGSPSGGTQHGA